MLKFKLSTDEFSKLSEVEQVFYAMSGEGYQLQVDGAADKSKLDEFRASNVELLKNQDQFKDVDLVKYRELQEQERKLLEGDLIAKKDFEGLIAQRTGSLTSDFQAKIDNLTKQLSESATSQSTMQSKYEIEGAASKAFSEHKISPDAYDAIMSQIKAKFSIDSGKAVARNGDGIQLGANGNLTVSEFVASQPEIFKIQSSGGRGKGSDQPASVANDDAKRAAYAKLIPSTP